MLERTQTANSRVEKNPNLTGDSRTRVGGRDDTAWLDAPSASRMVNAFAIEFVVRYMHDAAKLFGADYEAAIIFLAILEANGRQNIRQPWFVRDFADARVSLPAEMSRSISRQAVAESLGIPRETVRRKIADLIERGFLAEAPGGVITTRGVIGNEQFLAAQQRIVGYLRQFLSDLRQYAGMPNADRENVPASRQL